MAREEVVRRLLEEWTLEVKQGPIVRPLAGKRKCYACSSAKKAAKLKGVPFELESWALPDVPRLCPLCDQSMPEDAGRSRVPSLDRILPELGYVIENVWWICHDCNRQKSDLDPARAYRLWDRVWMEVRDRGLPLPATRLRPGDQNEDTRT